MNFNIVGHAYERKFCYQYNQENNAHVEIIHGEITVPDGAAALRKILNDEITAPEDLLRTEYFELELFGDYYASTRYMGASKTMLPKSVPVPIDSHDSIVVWDSGFLDFPIEITGNKEAILWASRKVLPNEKILDEYGSKCFLLLSANLLRKKGAMISKSISWERSAENLLWQLCYHNPQINYLLKAAHILVTFAEDGAIYIKTKKDKDGKPALDEAWLTLHGDGLENTHRSQKQGRNGDAFLHMVAALAKQFEAVVINNKFPDVRSIISAGAKMVESGYQIAELEKYTYKVPDIPAADEPDGVEIPIKNGVPVQVNTWVIADDRCEKGKCKKEKCEKDFCKRSLYRLAFDFVKTGEIDGLNFPVLKIGKLQTIDRGEIEAYSNISNIIKMYYESENPKGEELIKPLSIAVFGKPGSGKSFGVKQIAKNVLPKDVIEDITFNVSQFSENDDDLGACFQGVRDIILKGKLPLVFFDEFDSDGGALLKNFLMPMQDGKFKDSSGEHPLGKCILVFAGGTAYTFAGFCEQNKTDDGKQKKIPDFVSRIKGSIDIVGPNKKEADDKSEDKNFILRRALLLRGICNRDDRIDMSLKDFIDDSIIRAMLNVDEFAYGVRSMETILAMSDISFGKWAPATLPLFEQLSVHVDAREFTDLLLYDVIIQTEEGIMAKKIHEFFLGHLDLVADKNHPCKVPWDELTWHFKMDNLRQARTYPKKVAKFGGYIDLKGKSVPILKLDDKDIVEQLAIREHNEWWESKKEAGWTPGKPRDDSKKIHDCMYPWDELDEKTKDKDRNPIYEIPYVLEAVGKCVYKLYDDGKLTKEQIEVIAKAIHEDYRKNNPGSNYDMDWESLPEDIKKSNRDQANAFAEHIEFLGMKLKAKSAEKKAVKKLTGKQIEALAERIHNIWIKSKHDDGWIYSGTRNEEKKRHNLLVAYDELEESEKDKDRAIARGILPMLDKAGMGVYKA